MVRVRFAAKILLFPETKTTTSIKSEDFIFEDSTLKGRCQSAKLLTESDKHVENDKRAKNKYQKKLKLSRSKIFISFDYFYKFVPNFLSYL